MLTIWQNIARSAEIEMKRKYSFGAHRSAASLCDEKSHAPQIAIMKSSNMQHINTTKSYICMSQSTESMRCDGKRYLNNRLRTAPHKLHFKHRANYMRNSQRHKHKSHSLHVYWKIFSQNVGIRFDSICRSESLV